MEIRLCCDDCCSCRSLSTLCFQDVQRAERGSRDVPVEARIGRNARRENNREATDPRYEGLKRERREGMDNDDDIEGVFS